MDQEYTHFCICTNLKKKELAETSDLLELDNPSQNTKQRFVLSVRVMLWFYSEAAGVSSFYTLAVSAVKDTVASEKSKLVYSLSKLVLNTWCLSTSQIKCVKAILHGRTLKGRLKSQLSCGGGERPRYNVT